MTPDRPVDPPPRFATPYRMARPSARYRRILDAADRLGLELMPHQLHAIRLIAETRRDGRPHFAQFLASTSRQQGKTTTLRPVVVEIAERIPGARIGYTAQTRVAARDRVIEIGQALQDAGMPVKLTQGVGNERVEWMNGARLFPIAPTETAGHGAALSALIADEIWSIAPTTIGAILPALSATGGQLIAISTMGTIDSVVMNDLVERGRSGDDPFLAYLEWSIPEDRDPYDEDEWLAAMPALGRSVQIDAIRTQAATLTRSEFIRAYANRVVASIEPVVPNEWWSRSQDPFVEVAEWIVAAVEVGTGPTGGAIVAAWQHPDEPASAHIELAAYEPGSAHWIPARLAELSLNRQIRALAIDPQGPAGAIYSAVRSTAERAGIPIVQIRPSYLAAGTGDFYARLREDRITISPAVPLDDAIASAVRKTFGDAWLFDRRRSSADVSPLQAAAMAIYALNEIQTRPRPSVW